MYPISPFKENFNYKLINSLLNEQNDRTISNEDLRKTLKWLCSSPNITSIRVNILKTKAEQVLNKLREHLRSQLLNIYIHPFLNNTIIIESNDVSNVILQKYEKEIIVDTECASAVLRGAHIYAPGVLGMVSGCQLNDNVSVYADIAKKCKKGLQKIYSNEFKIFIGNGKIKMQRHQLFSSENDLPSGIAVEMNETISGCPAISETLLPIGEILLQNLPSIVCVQTLNPKAGETVIDMCASPGNKTTHIAELMENKGILVAIDKTSKKVAQLRSRCQDFNAKAHIFQADSTKIISNSTSLKDITEGPPFLPESFDKILLDAPCSVLGKRPQLVNRMTDNEIKSYVPLQRKLFENAVQLLKPEGTMIYSTCTITLAENEGMIAWALRNFDCLELIKPPIILGEAGWIGTSLTEEERSLVQRFGPDAKVDSVGFFFAYLRKRKKS